MDVERFQPSTTPPPRHGFVVAGRQTPYKKINLAVAACTKLGLPLTVIGDGPDHDKLKKMAGPTITFVTSATDNEMPRYFQSAEAFIFPGLDDFGIVAVEAMAAGTPVIAYKGGGALDYIKEGVSGLFFQEQTVDSLITTLQAFSTSQLSEQAIRQFANTFSIKAFSDTILQLLDNNLK